MKYVVEPGEFAVLIGRSATDIVGNATFTFFDRLLQTVVLLQLFSKETTLHNIHI